MDADFLADVESGDRLRGLMALRREIASAIAAGPDPRDLAALSLRLERVMEQIEAASVYDDADDDELAAKRRAKLSAAARP